jgi:DNA polymerase (family 10)
MDKDQIANFLNELALVLELDGANPFKVRAYANASRIVEGLSEDLNELVRNDELVNIKGIGRHLADHIAELLKAGRIAEYEALMRSVPPGVKQMLSIPGLGPKKVHHLWKVLGLETLGELEVYCQRHLLKNVPGFGAKTEHRILEGLAMFKRFAGVYRLNEAFDMAVAVCRTVVSWPEVVRADIAGSLRRRKETVKDIDVLVSTEQPVAVMERFISLPRVERVLQHGKTKSEVILDSGIQCDLRAVADEQYPFAMHYFTGSKEHNVAMRRAAKELGFKLNEYGLFREGSEESVRCSAEADLFQALGLQDIPPELRENMGEIEAAREHALPRLIEAADVRGVIHAHTNYTDGEASVGEIAQAAKRRGYEYIVIADHSQAVTVAGGMKPDEVERQFDEIDAVNQQLKGFRVLKGIEVDILADGALDYGDDLLSRFDVVIAAVHSRFGLDEQAMTERILRAVSNPHVDILAHPTGRLLLAREAYALDLKKVINACADLGTILEINAHPQRLDLDWRWCKYAKEVGAKLSLGLDAHSVDGLDFIDYGMGVARKGWLEKGDIINCLGADALLKLLRR